MICEHHRQVFESHTSSVIILSLLSDSWLGAEQRTQGADPKAGVWLVGWSSGHEHAAGRSDTCGA